MIPLTLGEVADLVDGAVAGPDLEAARETVVTAPPSVDSRDIDAGGLFVAVLGEHVDGHDYAEAAVAAGAAGVLAARPVEVPCVVTADPVVALGRLARAVLSRLPGCTVIGVTGSQGKTSAKDMLAQILERVGPTVAPRGSFNNEIGAPLTALRCDSDTRFLVVEMGARGRGHIRDLAAMAGPTIGLVLNVGVAHLGEFGTREDIAAAKGELVEALPVDGTTVLNIDDDLVRGMAGRTDAPVRWYGTAEAADVRLGEVELDAHGRPRFTLTTSDGSADLTLQLVGEHQAHNAAAAAATALAAGVPWPVVVEALGELTSRSRWRMEVHERADGVTVVNDAYNANPDSMRAALKSLAVLGSGGRRTVAVLGEMLELGAASHDEHDAVGRLVVRLNVSRLVVVGEGARPMHLGAELEGSWNGESVFVPDADAAVEFLRDDVGAGDVVLVKASRATGLERVAEALLAGTTNDEEEVRG
ncbi:MAG: UDP-N-acetylmuramoyl-tripeptide--D-alanyl-D-alanine ligase [Propionibacteriales bacterium]|nr:UDP-N-acetylmuramoyl-tripeptide--D-alanyl-D-alanine ligase [Propionibacteriales bacterium]